MKSDNYFVSKQQVQQAFNNAVDSYDMAAIVQKEVCQRLLERLEYIKIQPEVIADIGSGTGLASLGLAQQYSQASIISVDLAEKMLVKNREKTQSKSFISRVKKLISINWLNNNQTYQFVCGDAEQLPFADGSVDLIFSNLTLQWCQNLSQVFNEFRRVLKPGGLMLFTTLGRDTLKELRQSWAQVSDKVHVNAFADMHDIGDALYHAKVENPVMDSEIITINYQSVKQILLDLKSIGAHNQNYGREHALTGKRRLKAMYQAYEQFRKNQGYPVTYEVVYGHAWNPMTPVQQTQAQETSISLSQLKSTLRT